MGVRTTTAPRSEPSPPPSLARTATAAQRRGGDRRGDDRTGSQRRRRVRVLLDVEGLAALDRPLEPGEERPGRSRRADGERLGAAAGAGERDGELAAQPLALGVARHELPQLGDDVAVPAEPQPRLGEVGAHVHVVLGPRARSAAASRSTAVRASPRWSASLPSAASLANTSAPEADTARRP